MAASSIRSISGSAHTFSALQGGTGAGLDGNRARHSDGPLACGHLSVHPGSGLFASWKIRWIDLRHGLLSYRKRPELTEPERVFNLASVTAVRALAGVPKSAKRKFADCGFSVEGPAVGPDSGAAFVFIADSKDERDRWVERVTAACAWAQATHGPVVSIVPALVPPARLLADARGWVPLPLSPDATPFAAIVENPDNELAWYRLYFVAAEHYVFVAVNAKVERAPLFVAVMRDRACGGATRGLIFGGGLQRRLILPAPLHGAVLSASELLDAVLTAADPRLRKQRKHFKPIDAAAHGAQVRETLMRLEDMQFTRKHKIGVLYARHGQTEEGPMFANDIDQPDGDDAAFVRFLELLGTRVPLRGWDGYRAGLDVEADGTGTESVFREHHGMDVMFHVSSLLPHDRENSGQEVQRKRQIGNDIAAIVFVSGTTPYSPATVKCQFLHVYAVVQPDAEPGFWRVQFVRQAAMSAFGPPLASDRLPAGPETVDLIVTKLINGERTALASAPDFRLKQKRTDDVLLADLVKVLGRARGTAPLAPLAHVPDRVYGSGERGPRRDAIAPTPLASVALAPRLVLAGLPAHVLAWDNWEHGKYVYSTITGLFIGEAAAGHDEAVCVVPAPFSQLVVMDDLGVVVALCSATQLITVVYLSSIGEWTLVLLRASKHCSAFCVRRADGEVRICLTVRRALHIYVWSDASFVLECIVELDAVPLHVDYTAAGDLAIVTPTSALLVKPGTAQATVAGAECARASCGALWLPVSEPELVFFSADFDGVTLRERGAKACNPAISLPWSFKPVSFAFCDPYIAALSSFDMIEVRSLYNGALVQLLRLAPPLRLVSTRGGLFVASGADATSIFALGPVTAAPTSAPDTAVPSPHRAASSTSGKPRLGRRASLQAMRANRASVFVSALQGVDEDGPTPPVGNSVNEHEPSAAVDDEPSAYDEPVVTRVVLSQSVSGVSLAASGPALVIEGTSISSSSSSSSSSDDDA